DREQYYGDPRHVDVPLDALLSEAYAAVRRSLIDPAQASLDLRPGDPRRLRSLLEGPVPAPGPPGHGTVHVNVVDRQRNMVSATASGAWLSASPVVPALGFPLSSRCQTFSLDPGHANVVAPGKQPRTTLTPTLVTERGRPRMVIGTMGGDNQDQWNLQAFLSLALFGMPVQDALEAPRVSTLHAPNSFYPHGAVPGHVRIESRVPYSVRRELQARGHRLELRPDWVEGFVLAIVVDQARGCLMGGADPRGEGATIIPAYAIGWGQRPAHPRAAARAASLPDPLGNALPSRLTGRAAREAGPVAAPKAPRVCSSSPGTPSPAPLAADRAPPRVARSGEGEPRVARSARGGGHDGR